MDDLEKLFKKNIMECKFSDNNQEKVYDLLNLLLSLYNIEYTGLDYKKLTKELLSIYSSSPNEIIDYINTAEELKISNKYLNTVRIFNRKELVYCIEYKNNIFNIGLVLDELDVTITELLRYIILSPNKNPFLEPVINFITKTLVNYIDEDNLFYSGFENINKDDEFIKSLFEASKNILFIK